LSSHSSQDDLIMGAATLRTFMKELRPREVQIHSVLEHARFGASYLALNRVLTLTDHCISCGMVNRFCNVTNTFHLPFREM